MRKPLQQGFLMPTVVIMLGAATMIMLAVFQYIATTANLTSEVIYRQVALTAARGALDYGKEQFDNNLAFSGTRDGSGNPIDLLMFENDTYKVTYQVVVQSTSSDGRIKRVQGIGRVYMPKTASTARYTRIINGEIIRSQIVQKDPSDFSPLAWYDASCNNDTSTETDCDNDTVLRTGSGAASANPTSLREERNNGVYCNGSPRTTSPSNNQLDITRQGECGASNQTHSGFMFNFGSSLPKGVTITDARLRLTANAADSTALTVRIKGIDAANYPNFTTSSSAQLLPAGRTSATTAWVMPSWSSTGQASNSPNIAGIVQEIIDRGDWASGNNLGLILEHESGSGRRRARTTQITLSITYTGSQVPAAAGEQVETWRDRSGNGFDLTSPSSGSRPTKGTISGGTMNGKPMVGFAANTSWMNTLVPASSGRTANNYTAVVLMHVKNGTSVGGTGSIVSFYGSGTNNTRYSPFWRHPVQGFHGYDMSTGTNDNNICVARVTAERICKTSNPSIAGGGGWQIFSSREALTERDAMMRRNGNNSNFGQAKFYDPISLNAPYTLAVGGDAQTSAPTTEVDIAELILYDRQLTCPQMESLEQYLATKWGFSSLNSEGCAENNLPSY